MNPNPGLPKADPIAPVAADTKLEMRIGPRLERNRRAKGKVDADHPKQMRFRMLGAIADRLESLGNQSCADCIARPTPDAWTERRNISEETGLHVDSRKEAGLFRRRDILLTC